MNINEIRRLNLDRVIGNPGKHGRIADFARSHGQDPSYISQILNKHRTMGEKSARAIEEVLGIPSGDLDRPSSADLQTAARDLAEAIGADAITLLDLYALASPEIKVAALRVLETPQHSYNSQPSKRLQE